MEQKRRILPQCGKALCTQCTREIRGAMFASVLVRDGCTADGSGGASRDKSLVAFGLG